MQGWQDQRIQHPTLEMNKGSQEGAVGTSLPKPSRGGESSPTGSRGTQLRQGGCAFPLPHILPAPGGHWGPKMESRPLKMLKAKWWLQKEAGLLKTTQGDRKEPQRHLVGQIADSQQERSPRPSPASSALRQAQLRPPTQQIVQAALFFLVPTGSHHPQG